MYILKNQIEKNLFRLREKSLQTDLTRQEIELLDFYCDLQLAPALIIKARNLIKAKDYINALPLLKKSLEIGNGINELEVMDIVANLDDDVKNYFSADYCLIS